MTATDTTLFIREATSREDLVLCHPIFLELRPNQCDLQLFIEQIERQRASGYRLILAWRDETFVGCTGFRTLENTIYGRFLYVDDLVVTKSERSAGVGARLLDYVALEAQRLRCRHIVLDTALGHARAQRFYFRWGLLARGMHFVWNVPSLTISDAATN